MPVTSPACGSPPRTGPGGLPRTRWLWSPVVLYGGLIFLLSSVPHVGRLPGGISDKVGHTALYSGFGFLVSRALSARAPRAWPALVLACAALYGLSDEVHQLFVPGRQFELADIAADIGGAAIGAVAFGLCGIIARTPWARSR